MMIKDSYMIFQALAAV